MMRRGLPALMMLAIVSLVAPSAQAQFSSFDTWLEEFRIEAISKGIPESVATQALANLEEDEEVIELDQKQPEDRASFTKYSQGATNKKRVLRGRALLKEHHALLHKISQHYHVQPQYIVALWGIETDYGKRQGNYSVVQSLATLAYEGRRADFFRGELLNALRIIADQRIDPASLTGSWAGAMGNCQFMPSSYITHAVDWDRDGHADIWNSLPDTFASIANYLRAHGWNDAVGWGELATADTPGELVTPGEEDEGVFAVTPNYQVLLKWNRSRFFAISTGMLADKLVE